MAKRKDNVYDFPGEEYQSSKERIREKLIKRLKARVYTILLLVAIVAIAVISYVMYERSKVYETLSVQRTVPFSPAAGAYIEDFDGTVLMYSKDGAGAMDEKGNLLWNQTYDMQNPMHSMCGDTVAFADYGGATIYVQRKGGDSYEVVTDMPIRKITVSDNGVVAAVLEDVGVTWIYLYDSNGDVISYFRTTMEKSGYPVDLDISPSAELVAVSYYYIDVGETKSSVAFYNFGGVGQNNIDNYVSGYNYKNSLVPMVRFLSNSYSFALSDERISIYEGSQKPTSLVDTFITEDILSVYYDESHIAVITRNNDSSDRYKLTVYSNKGKVITEKEFDFDYSEVVFGNNQYVIYGNTDIYVATMDGRTRLEYKYDKPVRKIIPTSSATKYILVTESSIDTVQMK